MKRRGLGPKNDVLPTGKAITLRSLCVQCIFYKANQYFRGEKRTSRLKTSIVACLFVFLAYRICSLVLKLQNASDTHCNRVKS